jgi:hypothetical protein
MNLFRPSVFAVLLLRSTTVFSQISDNFSDGNFSQSPIWKGDTASFIVNASGELQLNAGVAGTSTISVEGNIPTNAVWDFQFRLGFSPSTSNLLRIYLLADQSVLSGSNGYFLEIGETGSNDAIRLFRQDGTSKTLIGTGTTGLVAVNPDIHLRVTRTYSGLWTVEAASGMSPLIPQCTAQDLTHSGATNRFFGLECVYTISNTTRFFLDNLNIALGQPDSDPPLLMSANAAAELAVEVVFNEPLNPTAAVNTTQFNISGGVGQPVTVSLQPNGYSVKLGLATPLMNGNYTLESTGIQDVYGNISGVQTTDFTFVKTAAATEFDLLINEIMADQTPSQGLPEAEWLELFNRSGKTVDLVTLRLKDATGTPIPLPSYLLEPGNYVVLTAAANATGLQSATQGVVLGTPMGISMLNNDGDILSLSDISGNVIDQVSYSSDWHTSVAQKEGGWSLERINPGLPCLGSENWQSCTAPLGGTPGLPNTALSTAPDIIPPHLSQVLTESTTSLLLTFSEGVDKNTAQTPASYHINPPRNITAATTIPGNRAQVRLTLSDPLQLSTLYALTGTAALTDCSGNRVPATDTLYFGVAEKPERYDILINEIMPKHSPSAGLPTVEWIELINRSTKIIDLSSLSIRDGNSTAVLLPTLMMPPGRYVVLTATANVPVLQASTSGYVQGGAFSASLLNDDGDEITLSDENGLLVDRVAYRSDWHTTDGKANGGWSLERINFNLPCIGKENWQSCPTIPGGTPGVKNASFQMSTDEKNPSLLWAYPTSANTILLTFSEGLLQTTAEDETAYKIYPNKNISSAIQQTDNETVILSLSEPLEEFVLYAVTASSNVTDCSGNSAVETDTAVLGIPQRPDPQDIVLNEAMFNPSAGNVRYFECYNRSNKVFDWQKFFIGNFYNGAAVTQIDHQRLVIPGQYPVFTTNTANIVGYFDNIHPEQILENTLPTLDDKRGNITLYWVENGDTVVLDALDYEDTWHNGLFSVGDREGVALERIRTNGPTNDPANWTSASSLKTGAPGTPTLPNAQGLNATNPADKLIELNPARLSPDDDGYEDFLDIRYTLPRAGYAAAVGIFDADGNSIQYLVRQALIGTEGALRWDGDAADGSKARPGIYLLFLEIFSPDGATMSLKKTFVLVAKQ